MDTVWRFRVLSWGSGARETQCSAPLQPEALQLAQIGIHAHTSTQNSLQKLHVCGALRVQLPVARLQSQCTGLCR